MTRLRALVRKEFNQIRRDKRMAMSLIVPPTLQLLLFGFALDSTVSHLRLGVIDWSRTPESREMVSTLTESKSFQLGGDYASVRDLEAAISRESWMPASWCRTSSRAISGAARPWMCRSC